MVLVFKTYFHCGIMPLYKCHSFEKVAEVDCFNLSP